MKSTTRTKRILLVLIAALLLALPQAAFAAEADTTSTEQLTQLEEPSLPVGGVLRGEAKYVPEDLDIPGGSAGKKVLRNAGGKIDDVFIKGASKMGYNSLSADSQRAFYDAIDEAAVGFMNSYRVVEPADYGFYIIAEIDYADLGISDYKDAVEALYAYELDHPAYYWLSTGYIYGLTSVSICIHEEYADPAVRKRIDSMISSGVREYAQLAESGTDTLDMISIVHDKLCNDIEYAYKSDGSTSVEDKWAHCVQGVFDPDHRQAVCEGYADAFSLIMNYLGIPNYYMVGYSDSSGAGGGGLHAWNAVSADGGRTYLYMDVTWDDYGDLGYSYRWFGMPASDFEKSHRKSDREKKYGMWLYDINEEFSDSFKSTYYYAGGRYYDGRTDVETLVSEAVAKAARAGDHVSFMASTVSDLEDVAYELGMRLEYYSIAYKDTRYYYMIAKSKEDNHVHEWDDPYYSWSSDKRKVRAERCCYAPNCKVGEETETVSTDATVVKEANCTEAGITIYYAEFTNKAFEAQTKKVIVKAYGHDWDPDYTIEKEASYTETGRKSIHCLVCGEIKPGSEVTIAKKEKADLPKVTILTPKAAKKAATVKWKKVSAKNRKKIGSIQIQYSKDKNFRKGVKTTTAKKSAVSKKITKLTSKKKYYIRIRAYKKSGGITHVSKWSKVKYVKVK